MVILKHYAWLIALGVFAIWSSSQITLWPKSIQDLVIFFPYVTVALGVFIALWLNRMQPVLILLSLGCFNAILFYFSSYALGFELTRETLFPVLIFLLPFNILLWILLPEKGVFNKRLNTLVFLVFLVEAVIIYGVLQGIPETWLAFLNTPIMKHSDVILLSFSTGVMFLLTLFFIVLKMNQSSFKALYHAVFVVLVLMLYGVNQGFELNVLAWFSAFSAIALTLSMIFEAHHIAYTDELTGIQGRRALMEHFLGMGKKYTLAMVDIDHFKQFNDTYGHDVGDEVLRRVARVLDGVKEGRAFRYGGEEFTLVFANKKLEEVMPELEYIRRKVESGIIEFKTGIHSTKTNVTISIGVAESNESFKAQDILKFADQALYEAKLAGRNQVVKGDYNPSKVQVNQYKGSKNDGKSSGTSRSR
ncbi:hypothetical protein MNBD_GAMMA04-205 [hydrothermal vent metagenome]|uniref:GGDEF domain-containing protein n=1 Tax=hydrothermal vent metagenome TaxID=652676 RepID=A0A3B0X1X8_9ZZZZ